jgi:subfamily B ATP-binding cassette protein MsbA
LASRSFSQFKIPPRLLEYLRPFKWHLLGSALLAFPLAGLRASPVPLIKFLVDDLLVNKDQKKLLLFPILFIGLYVINFVVRFFHYYWLRIVIARVNQRIKNDLYDHLMGLSADYFTTQSTGGLISRAGQDPNLVDQGVACINILMREPLTFLCLFGYSLKLNWKLTLVTFLVFPPLAWVFAATSRNLKRYIAAMQEQNSKLFGVLQETFTGFRVIHLFGLQDYSVRKFREQSDLFTQYHLKMAAMEELSHPAVELLTSFVIAIVIYYGGAQVIAGQMSSGDLLAFFAAFAMMMNPIRTLNDVNIRLAQMNTAFDRISELFGWKSKLSTAASPIQIPGFTSELSFEGVHFSYPDAPERPILQGVSFKVPRGSRVALVGESGAGKSSLISLLPRVFDVTGGAIRIDGRDLRECEIESLRRQFAVVSQDVFLFNDTVYENIRCGNREATREQVIEAARQANALGFIDKLSEGWETRIGDRGQKLSGGERQRLSIARAFLRQAPILVLDEATSNLDTASERAVQEALDKLMQDRTSLVIAHRLSTIQSADLILVLKSGKIVEAGTHVELLAGAGEYSRFHFAAQART